MVVRIGTFGWSYDHWRHVLCDPAVAARDRLDVYARAFECDHAAVAGCRIGCELTRASAGQCTRSCQFGGTRSAGPGTLWPDGWC